MTIHNRGDGIEPRPVHPACAADAYGNVECTCHILWAGMEREDFEPMVAVEKKRRNRSCAVTDGSMHRHHDRDENQSESHPDNSTSLAAWSGATEPSNEVSYGRQLQKSHLELMGFWARDEFYQGFVNPVRQADDEELRRYNAVQSAMGRESASRWLTYHWHPDMIAPTVDEKEGWSEALRTA